MHNFVNGTYRGFRTAGPQAIELYGEYQIEVVGTAKDGTPMVKVNGKGRALKVHGHSNGSYAKSGHRLEAAAMIYDPNYQGRHLHDDVRISADPQFRID